MNAIITFSFCAIVFLAQAQEFKNSNLQSLVDAERAFSAMAKEKNTRDAFIYFFSDSAVSSAPGQGPRLGKKHLEQQQANDSWLHWFPTYSDISASGDFGFNTGPWEFRQKKSDEKPVAYGEFVSVWKKDNDGNWKVAIDIGINHGAPAKSSTVVMTSVHPLKKNKGQKYQKGDIIQLERAFLDDFRTKGTSAYNAFLSDEVRWFRSGAEPIVGSSPASQLLASSTEHVEYSLMGGDISSAGDLAYVYGKASFDVTRDGTTQRRNGSYMRFWKKEDGKSWKIVLDLITN